MKFEETIQYAFDHFPITLRERDQVLNQMFCAISGYSWVNGELILEYNFDTEYSPVLNKKGKAEFNPDSLNKNIQEFFEKLKEREDGVRTLLREKGEDEEMIEKITLNDKQIMEKVLSLFRKDEEREVWFYPLSIGNSSIFKIPTDIKPDWLEGIRETILLLLKYGFGGKKSEMNEWQKEQHALAEEKLIKLAKDFEVPLPEIMFKNN